MNSFYPLKFKTIFKEKIWGGNKIKTILKKDFSPLENCGETWELSTVKGNISEIANGEFKGMLLDELLKKFPDEIMGSEVVSAFGTEFPLLIKFIDAQQDLSVQVHPDDTLAKARHNGMGKTEMWYIMQADNGASLIAGFNRPLNKEQYNDYFSKGTLDEILNRVEVEKGDVFYIPAGRIHTIGKGIMLAEIQQTSDLTYRIYDFDRVDAQGNKRELHVEEALDALDYTFHENYKTPYELHDNQRSTLVQSPYFTTNKFSLSQLKVLDYSAVDSFVIYICTEGQGSIKYNGGEQPITQGDVFLVPSVLKEIKIQPENNLELLEVYIG
ncbi:AraC family ligand binding domain-containing protein [Fulvivirga ulvae]|uniref:type I phosphomannose isomerase catalytic subunit n=1 Tax=Fulvivirga ulvae TaxID=2904245 RepID=UPI001F40E5D3|nr:type I phosphomannose isomerase catalytic subunit [Fulvivirga ulvae]UII30600.1 AraC family ligand binding domain-containing protein [Fulvivirga ulvae]